MKKLDVKQIVILGMMIALEVVLARFLSINAWNIRIGFGFVPIVLVAMLYGPIKAGAVAAIADVIGAIAFPTGAYFVGFTITALLNGAMFGLLLYKEQTWPRIIISAAIAQFVFGLLLNTLWISILYGQPYFATFVTRIPQCVILFVVEVIVIKLFSVSIPKIKIFS